MPSMSGPSDHNAPKAVYRAAYYDGISAVRHDVTVQMCEGAVDIISADGEVLDQWLYSDIVAVDQGSGGHRVSKLGSNARLNFTDTEAFRTLHARAPQMHAQEKRARRGMVLAIAVTVSILLTFYVATPVLTSAIVTLTPLSYEAKLGRRFSKDIVDLFGSEENKGVCASDRGSLALRKVVEDLARHNQAPFPYEVRVLDAKMVNAMALPGGYIFVFRGLLDQARSQDELIGVLAHEMAHVDRRHPMQAMVRSYGTSILSDMMFGGSAMGGISSTLMSMSYSRKAEEQADAAGIATLQRAGLSTDGLADFFDRLSTKEEKDAFGLPDFLSTHPNTEAREQRARGVSRSVRSVLQDGEWADLRAICEG